MTWQRATDLVRVSLLYLVLPHAIFLLGWLHWWVGLPILLLLLVAWFRVADSGHAVPMRGLLFAMAAALAMLLQSGVGGFGPQDADWAKHLAVLKDLIRFPWPVIYEDGHERLALVYYTAYYLPAALVGKFAGWRVANLALFAWSWLGLVLALIWFQVLVGRRAVWVTVLFFAFSGLDALGLLSGRIPVWWHIEWWAGHWSYQSGVTQLWWVPHIAIGGWIATALVLDCVQRERVTGEGLLLLGLTPLFSPFITLGVMVYLALGRLPRSIRDVLTIQNAAGLLMLILMGMYFTAKFSEQAAVRGFIFSSPMKSGPASLVAIVGVMLAFWLLEFGAYGLLVGTGRHAGRTLGVTMTILFALTFYRYGYYNDLAMRASIPALFVLAVLVGREVFDPASKVWRRRLLIFLLAIGSVTPFVEWKRHAERMWESKSVRFPAPVWAVRSLPEVHRGTYEPAGIPFLRQYTGSRDAPFFRYLARRPTPE